MRRMYTALALLLLAVALCTSEFLSVSRNADRYIWELEKIEQAVKADDRDKAYELAVSINDSWKNTVPIIDMLLYHDYVDAITQQLVTLHPYIEEGDYVEVIATCKRAKEQLQSLKQSEKPLVENII